MSTHSIIEAYFHYKYYCSQRSDFVATFENFTIHYAVKETILHLKHIVLFFEQQLLGEVKDCL